MIKTSVTSLELQSIDGKNINISNLENDIVIVIPISSPPTNISNGMEHYFLKPNKISIRSHYAELADAPVSITLGVAEEGAVIELFVKFGSRPTMDKFDHNFILEFTSTYKKRSVAIVPSVSGLLYVGLLFLGAKNATEHSRKRRSCFGHGRDRRSCVGVKDPPPKGVSKVVIPQYDPLTDVNYTLTISQSSCLYWSDDKGKWTSDGCKVI